MLFGECIAKCSYPLVEERRVLIAEYSDPALEGHSVTFGCPPGLIMVGSNTSTCMENGKWNPDPVNVTCKGERVYLLLNSALIV